MHRPFWTQLNQWLIVLSLPVFLLAADLRAVTNQWIVRWEYSKAGFPADPYGLSTAERTDLAVASVDYIRTDADMSILADLELPDGSPAYNERELQHMADVQRVYRQMIRAGSITGGLVLIGAIILLSMEPTGRRLLAALINGSMLTVGLLGAVGAFMAVSWNDFFTAFHRVFFEGESWLFAYSDTLIRLFPIKFWVDVTTIVVVGLVLAAAIIGISSWVLKRRPVETESGST
jgi:integral membrane protein (TIGR01906 family)